MDVQTAVQTRVERIAPAIVRVDVVIHQPVVLDAPADALGVLADVLVDVQDVVVLVVVTAIQVAPMRAAQVVGLIHVVVAAIQDALGVRLHVKCNVLATVMMHVWLDAVKVVMTHVLVLVVTDVVVAPEDALVHAVKHVAYNAQVHALLPVLGVLVRALIHVLGAMAAMDALAHAAERVHHHVLVNVLLDVVQATALETAVDRHVRLDVALAVLVGADLIVPDVVDVLPVLHHAVAAA